MWICSSLAGPWCGRMSSGSNRNRGWELEYLLWTEIQNVFNGENSNLNFELVYIDWGSYTNWSWTQNTNHQTTLWLIWQLMSWSHNSSNRISSNFHLCEFASDLSARRTNAVLPSAWRSIPLRLSYPLVISRIGPNVAWSFSRLGLQSNHKSWSHFGLWMDTSCVFKLLRNLAWTQISWNNSSAMKACFPEST